MEQEFNPQDGYIISANHHISNDDKEIISVLYQPIIGILATGIYQSLASMINYHAILSDKIRLSKLINYLVVDLKNFTEAIHRLEATGLVRTFVNEDENGKVFIFEIQPPVSEVDFFKDDLFCALLLESVGKEKFVELSKWHKYYTTIHQGFTEISKTIPEVFHLTVPSITITNEVKPQNENQDSNKTLIEKQNVTLNVEEIKKYLLNSFVKFEDLKKYINELKTAKLVYGLEEYRIVKLLEKSVDIETNKIDIELFKENCNESFDAGFRTKNQYQNTNSLDDSNLKLDEDPLIQAFQSYTPLEFLQILKQELGSFVTDNEKRTIYRVVENQNMKLPLEVVNALIHYYLVDKEFSNLSKGPFEATLADWQKHQIKSARQAMEYTKKLTARRVQTKNSKNYRTRKIIEKEKLPEWAINKDKQSNRVTNNKQAKAQQEKISELLKKTK